MAEQQGNAGPPEQGQGQQSSRQSQSRSFHLSETPLVASNASNLPSQAVSASEGSVEGDMTQSGHPIRGRTLFSAPGAAVTSIPSSYVDANREDRARHAQLRPNHITQRASFLRGRPQAPMLAPAVPPYPLDDTGMLHPQFEDVQIPPHPRHKLKTSGHSLRGAGRLEMISLQDDRSVDTARQSSSKRRNIHAAHLRLIISDDDFFLTREEIFSDSPNALTRLFESIQGEMSQSMRGSPRASPPTVDSFGLCHKVYDRNSRIFKRIILPYLRAAPVFPLDVNARSALASSCMPDESLYDVLHGEASYWGFTHLQELAREHKQLPEMDAQDRARDQANKEKVEKIRSGVLRLKLRSSPMLYRGKPDSAMSDALEADEDIEQLLEKPKHLLNDEERRQASAYYMAPRRVIAWRNSLPAKLPDPVNTHSFIADGWRMGVMYYNCTPSLASAPFPAVPNSDLDMPLAYHGSDASSRHFRRQLGQFEPPTDPVVYIIKTDKVSQSNEPMPQGEYDIISILPSPQGASSCRALRIVLSRAKKVGRQPCYHECMQNILGRHGLQILFKTEMCLVFTQPIVVIRSLLIIGYYKRGSLEVTSHPYTFMDKVLVENRWSDRILTQPLHDDEFHYKEQEIRGECKNCRKHPHHYRETENWLAW